MIASGARYDAQAWASIRSMSANILIRVAARR
jgi:hypothetical protein